MNTVNCSVNVLPQIKIEIEWLFSSHLEMQIALWTFPWGQQNMSMKIKFLILPNDKTKHLDKINMFKESSLIQTVEQNDLLYYFYWQIHTHLYEDNC